MIKRKSINIYIKEQLKIDFMKKLKEDNNYKTSREFFEKKIYNFILNYKPTNKPKIKKVLFVEMLEDQKQELKVILKEDNEYENIKQVVTHIVEKYLKEDEE